MTSSIVKGVESLMFRRNAKWITTAPNCLSRIFLSTKSSISISSAMLIKPPKLPSLSDDVKI